jgi:ferredoxin
MLVIQPDECIDCGVCEPECPVDAIKPDTEGSLTAVSGNVAGGNRVILPAPIVTISFIRPPAVQDDGVFTPQARLRVRSPKISQAAKGRRQVIQCRLSVTRRRGELGNVYRLGNRGQSRVTWRFRGGASQQNHQHRGHWQYLADLHELTLRPCTA